jgi:signal transduction histidine kinase
VPDTSAATAVVARRPATPRRGDLVAAALTFACGTTGLLSLPALAATDPVEPVDVPPVGGAGWWVVVLALAVQAAAVAWARARPRAALVVVAVPALLTLAGPGPGAASGLVALAVVVVVYRSAVAAGVASIRWALTVTVALAAVGYGASGSTADLAPTPGLVVLVAVAQALVVVALGLVPALVVASRRAVRDAQAGELRALAREQDARVQTALARQRTAMARELHDVAAHHLSGIALMASAVDRQIGSDPEAARRGVREVREQSRVVLADLRRVVGLLREEDGAETGVLTLAAVPDLVAAAVGLGDDVTLEVLAGEPGAPGPLGEGTGPLAQLAGYRMVQEALANARAHAPGAVCRVTVDDRATDVVVLTVRNGPPPDDGARAGRPVRAAQPARTAGYGLRGMRERADLVGADLRHGPTPDGGWEVRLAIPREPAAPEQSPTPTEGGTP